jgi:hypothetical protein
MIPRNKSHMILDLQMGQFFENILIKYINEVVKIPAMHGDKSNKRYPDCMILGKDKGILAYFEVKYHGAPFISALQKMNRYCYESSTTLDVNKIFGNNYLNYISQKRLTHPYLVELFIFLRKYQYFIHYIKINKQILCSFYKEEESIQDRILNIKQMLNLNEDNLCSIKFELLPKFKKSEINFVIPNNVMELEINFHIKLINEDNKIDISLCPGTEIYIKNLDEILEKIQINNINKKLSKLFDLYIEEFKEKNFKILNKFVNYIENYLPTLLGDDLKKKDEKDKEEIKSEEDNFVLNENKIAKKKIQKYEKTQQENNEELNKLVMEEEENSFCPKCIIF